MQKHVTQTAALVLPAIMFAVHLGTAKAQNDIEGYAVVGSYTPSKPFSTRYQGKYCGHGNTGNFTIGMKDGRIYGFAAYGVRDKAAGLSDLEKKYRGGKAGHRFEYEIRDDGTWGSWNDDGKFFYREHDNAGDIKWNWVKGKLTADGTILVDIKATKRGATINVCHGRGAITKRRKSSGAEIEAGIISRQEKNLSDALVRFEQAGDCQSRWAKDADGIAYEFVLTYRDKRDAEPELASSYLKVAANNHLRIAETALAQNCREMATDQIRKVKRMIRRLDWPEVKGRADKLEKQAAGG